MTLWRGFFILQDQISLKSFAIQPHELTSHVALQYRHIHSGIADWFVSGCR